MKVYREEEVTDPCIFQLGTRQRCVDTNLYEYKLWIQMANQVAQVLLGSSY
jgi:hypothetical protein